MPACVWPLLLTCACTSLVAQIPQSEIPIPDMPHGRIADRFRQTTADEMREHRPVPLTFDRPAAGVLGRDPGAALVSAAALRHKVPKEAKKAHDRGLNALQHGDHDRALEHLQRAVALDDEYALAHSNLGVALVRQNKLAEGEAEMRRAIALDPYVDNGHSNLAWVLEWQGKRTEAIAMAQRALEIVPGNPRALMLLDRLRPGATQDSR